MLGIKQIRSQVIIATMFLLCVAVTSAQAADEETRRSVSTQQSKSDRDRGIAGKVSQDEFSALNTSGSRQTSKRSAVSQETSAAQSSVASNAVADYNFWFYSADVILFNDHDDDGHFHGIDLLFDADTNYQEADVYAVVYLSLEDGPWNEYSATDDFTLFGSAAEDEFVIVTELVSGYPTGSYDLLIELFDAYDNAFLASYGPADTSELAFLPLEDSSWDVPYVAPTTVIVHDDHGGGSFGWLTILALFSYWANCARNGLRNRFSGSSWRLVRRKKSSRFE